MILTMLLLLYPEYMYHILILALAFDSLDNLSYFNYYSLN